MPNLIGVGQMVCTEIRQKTVLLSLSSDVAVPSVPPER